MAAQTREKYAGSEFMTAIALLAIVAGAGAFSGWASLNQQREAKAEAVTDELVQQVADSYMQTPFALELHLRQFEAVQNSAVLSESPDQRRIFELGADRTAMAINRMAQIHESARTSPDGAEPFLLKNIANHEAAIAKTIEAQGASIPANRPQHRTMMADLLELELWYRTLAAVRANQPVSPASTNLQNASN